MHLGFMNWAGNHLHRLRAGSVASNIPQVAAAAHHHAMPAKQRFFRERLRKRLVQVNHRLRDASLRWPNSALVRSQAQLSTDGGLDARPIQDFTFDLRSRHRLRAHGLNGELIALFFPQVPNRADEHTSIKEKLLLSGLKAHPVPSEIGPV